MNPDQLESRMANLPEEGQDALAQLALMEMKKRSRLMQLASGSIWNKFGLIFPIVVSVALLGFKGSLADYLPFVIVFLLFVIQGASASIHSRIDAIYELMKLEDRMGLQPTAKKKPNDSCEATGDNVSG